MAKHGCLKCLKSYNLHVNYSGFERHSWTQRDIDTHREQVECFKNAATKFAKEKMEQESGIRYSQLLELTYLDIVWCRPMHNPLFRYKDTVNNMERSRLPNEKLMT